MTYNCCVSPLFTRDWDYHEREKVDLKRDVLTESRKTTDVIICLEQCFPTWKSAVQVHSVWPLCSYVSVLPQKRKTLK